MIAARFRALPISALLFGAIVVLWATAIIFNLVVERHMQANMALYRLEVGHGDSENMPLLQGSFVAGGYRSPMGLYPAIQSRC